MKNISYFINIGESSLTSISSFNNLETLTGEILIKNNNFVTKIDGFEKLNDISYNLTLSNNKLLNNIESFNNIICWVWKNIF